MTAQKTTTEVLFKTLGIMSVAMDDNGPHLFNSQADALIHSPLWTGIKPPNPGVDLAGRLPRSQIDSLHSNVQAVHVIMVIDGIEERGNLLLFGVAKFHRVLGYVADLAGEDFPTGFREPMGDRGQILHLG